MNEKSEDNLRSGVSFEQTNLNFVSISTGH